MASLPKDGTRTDRLDPEIGRRVGWDIAMHGIDLSDEIHGCAREGFLAAKERLARGEAKRLPLDRYVSKILFLRLSAWRRSRIFDIESMTPEFLRKIDKTFCPITREELTHGTGELSDWSVDRVRNDAGYHAMNVTIMSARANVAKDQLQHRQLLRLATMLSPGEGAYKGLDSRAWTRMAVYTAFAQPVTLEQAMQIPMVVLPPLDLPSENFTMVAEGTVRHVVAYLAHRPKPRAVMASYNLTRGIRGKKAGKLFERYLDRLLCQMQVDRAAGATILHAVEDAGWCPSVRDSWARVCAELGPQGIKDFMRFISSHGLCPRHRLDDVPSMGEETGGYLSHEWVADHEEPEFQPDSARRRARMR